MSSACVARDAGATCASATRRWDSDSAGRRSRRSTSRQLPREPGVCRGGPEGPTGTPARLRRGGRSTRSTPGPIAETARTLPWPGAAILPRRRDRQRLTRLPGSAPVIGRAVEDRSPACWSRYHGKSIGLGDMAKAPAVKQPRRPSVICSFGGDHDDRAIEEASICLMSLRTYDPVHARHLLMSSRTTSGRARSRAPSAYGAVQGGLHVVVVLEVLGEQPSRMSGSSSTEEKPAAEPDLAIRSDVERPRAPSGTKELFERLPHRHAPTPVRAPQARAGLEGLVDHATPDGTSMQRSSGRASRVTWAPSTLAERTSSSTGSAAPLHRDLQVTRRCPPRLRSSSRRPRWASRPLVQESPRDRTATSMSAMMCEEKNTVH